MIFLFSWVLFRFHVKFEGCRGFTSCLPTYPRQHSIPWTPLILGIELLHNGHQNFLLEFSGQDMFEKYSRLNIRMLKNHGISTYIHTYICLYIHTNVYVYMFIHQQDQRNGSCHECLKSRGEAWKLGYLPDHVGIPKEDGLPCLRSVVNNPNLNAIFSRGIPN